MRSFDFLSPWEGSDYVLPGDEKAAPPEELDDGDEPAEPKDGVEFEIDDEEGED